MYNEGLHHHFASVVAPTFPADFQPAAATSNASFYRQSVRHALVLLEDVAGSTGVHLVVRESSLITDHGSLLLTAH